MGLLWLIKYVDLGCNVRANYAKWLGGCIQMNESNMDRLVWSSGG
jgi:hypothetical protein